MKKTNTKQGFRNSFLFVISLVLLLGLSSALTYVDNTGTTTHTISGSVDSATLTTPNQTWLNHTKAGWVDVYNTTLININRN